VLREFYKERDVVREERRMRVESSSQGRLMEIMLATAFLSHPYRNLIGWAHEIESLRAKEAEEFFHRHYVPGNITMAVVGDVNPAEVKRLAQRYFANIPPRPLAPPARFDEPPQQGEKRAELRTEDQPVVIVGYRRPSQFDKDDAVFDVIESVLSSGRTGWLYQDLVRDRRISIGAGASGTFPGGKYPNLFMVLSVPAVGKSPHENEAALYAVLERLKTTKVDEETLNRVKTKVRAGLLRQLDSNQGLASQLTYYQALYGDWRKMFEDVHEVEKVTADDVQRVAREYFVDTGRTVAYTRTIK
jgi:predicted Zn-dependent peptidase